MHQNSSNWTVKNEQQKITNWKFAKKLVVGGGLTALLDHAGKNIGTLTALLSSQS